MPIVAVGLIAPFAIAGGPDRGRGGHDRGRDTRIVIRRQPALVVAERRPARVEVSPRSVRFAAYQSEDRVIVDIKGVNSGEGFITTISAGESWRGTPEINLCNLAPGDAYASCEVPFSITAAVHAHSAVSSVTVRVAGQTYTVPVTQATPLS